MHCCSPGEGRFCSLHHGSGHPQLLFSSDLGDCDSAVNVSVAQEKRSCTNAGSPRLGKEHPIVASGSPLSETEKQHMQCPCSECKISKPCGSLMSSVP